MPRRVNTNKCTRHILTKWQNVKEKYLKSYKREEIKANLLSVTRGSWKNIITHSNCWGKLMFNHEFYTQPDYHPRTTKVKTVQMSKDYWSQTSLKELTLRKGTQRKRAKIQGTERVHWLIKYLCKYHWSTNHI